jgi:hypothetical protein
MAQDNSDIGLEAFAAIAAAAGLVLDAAEQARLHEGYKGLQTLLARLPQGPAMEDEPAVIALVPGARVVARLPSEDGGRTTPAAGGKVVR